MLLLVAFFASTPLVPASAASPVGAPWVVAASPSSVTLDWPAKAGTGRYTVFFARSLSAVGKSSAARQKTQGRSSKLKVTGLRPGTMYCFQVARANGSGRSQKYCHPTTKRPLNLKATKVRVVTYNVCSEAKGCGHFPSRARTIVKRIRESKADVVALQELSRDHRSRLFSLLRKEGFSWGSDSSSEVIVFRTSKLRTARQIERQCTEEYAYRTREQEPDWHTDRTYREDGFTWVWNDWSDVWTGTGQSCIEWDHGEIFGSFVSRKPASAAWVAFEHIATGKRFIVVNTHLSNGPTAKKSRERGKQTASMMTTMAKLSRLFPYPIIYTGDFNSHRGLANDAPRKLLAKTGHINAYDVSTTYSKAYVDSFNNYDVRPRRGIRFGKHLDQIYVPSNVGVSAWKVVAPLRKGKHVRPLGSDHHPVAATLWLP